MVVFVAFITEVVLLIVLFNGIVWGITTLRKKPISLIGIIIICGLYLVLGVLYPLFITNSSIIDSLGSIVGIICAGVLMYFISLRLRTKFGMTKDVPPENKL